jgi:hypothetical protein
MILRGKQPLLLTAVIGTKPTVADTRPTAACTRPVIACTRPLVASSNFEFIGFIYLVQLEGNHRQSANYTDKTEHSATSLPSETKVAGNSF